MRDNWNSRDNDANCEGFPANLKQEKKWVFIHWGVKSINMTPRPLLNSLEPGLQRGGF